MIKISKLFEIAKPYQLTIRGPIKGDIEVYLVGYGKGMGRKVSCEDADRMGNGLFEFVTEKIREELDKDEECSCSKFGESSGSGMKCSNCGREL